MHRQSTSRTSSNMRLSLVFSVLASIVVFATAYPTQGATGIAKRSNVGKRDSEEVGIVDTDYQFKDYRKRDEGKRDSEYIGNFDYIEPYKKSDEGKRTVLNYFDYDTDK
ncbi:hypothetical protein BDR04DRAFT_1232889 [Suillus decipiens]|nr:hypothetical protein BDR04DRAFT_1232889 [Suillus decipiens]